MEKWARLEEMRAIFAVSLHVFVLSSCNFFQKKEPEAPKKSPIRILGEVTSVHPAQEFVLFKRYGPGDIPERGLFSARSVDGRRAVSLNPTGEKLGRYYAADYTKDADLPRMGDLVVISTLSEESDFGGWGESYKKSNPSPVVESP